MSSIFVFGGDLLFQFSVAVFCLSFENDASIAYVDLEISLKVTVKVIFKSPKML